MKKVKLQDTTGFEKVDIDLNHPKRSKKGCAPRTVLVEHTKKPRGKHRRRDVVTAGNIGRMPIEVKFGSDALEAFRLEPGEFHNYKVPHKQAVDTVMWRHIRN